MNSYQPRRVAAALGIGVVLLLSGAVALGAAPSRGAAANAPQNQGQASDRNPDRQGARAQGPAQRRESRLERRLDFLHRRLNIRASQERLWNSFAAALRDEAERVRDRFADARDRFFDRRDNGRRDGARDRGRDDPGPTVLERLEQRRERLANQSERIDHLVTAIRPLYAALDREQRRTADRLFFRPFAGGGPFLDRRQQGARPFGRFGFGNGYYDLERNNAGRAGEPDPRDQDARLRPANPANPPDDADAGGPDDSDNGADADTNTRENL